MVDTGLCLSPLWDLFWGHGNKDITPDHLFYLDGHYLAVIFCKSYQLSAISIYIAARMYFGIVSNLHLLLYKKKLIAES